MSRAAEPVDDYVNALVVARLAQPDAATLIRTGPEVDVQGLRDEAAAQRTRLRELTDLFTGGCITSAQLARGSEAIRGRLEELERHMAKVVQVDSLGPLVTAPDVKLAWEAADLDIRRAVIDALMTVTMARVGQGRRGFDAQTVVVDWRRP